MLLCGLFWPGYGFLGSGASANAGALKTFAGHQGQIYAAAWAPVYE